MGAEGAEDRVWFTVGVARVFKVFQEASNGLADGSDLALFVSAVPRRCLRAQASISSSSVRASARSASDSKLDATRVFGRSQDVPKYFEIIRRSR